MLHKCRFFLICFSVGLTLNSVSHAEAEKAEAKPQKWIQLFNGKDLKDWSAKFTGQDLGVNYKDTFVVKDGLLKVKYDKWTEFKGEFGHLFYKTPYSNYRLRATYRFVGKQVKNGPGWAVRNNGLMIHCQDPKTMEKDQKFPDCIEVQLLGGDGQKKRGTLNIVTPGTHVLWKGKLQKGHVLDPGGPTFHGDQWVTVEVEVHNDTLIKHIVDGKVVCEYSKPQLNNGTPVTGGYISIQAETAPIEFKKIELLPLEK